MLYKYKIQKVIDGNGKIKYVVKYRTAKWYKWLNWLWFWNTIGNYKTIKESQDKIEEEIVKDKAVERRRLAKKGKVLEEFKYKMVPNYVPEEQIEKFITTSKK